MRTFTIMIFLALIAKISLAQDTAYVSRNKVTALFFPAPVKILDGDNDGCLASNKGNGVLALKANAYSFKAHMLTVQDQNSEKVYHIPVVYSYGRAGRRIVYNATPASIPVVDRRVTIARLIAQQLASGKRTEVATHKKAGGVKAWIDKISLADNRIFLRLDVRNRSNLPYGIDFVRFYIRGRNTVVRMAAHEQEIVPVYTTLSSHLAVSKGRELAQVFAFKRFSLSDDDALFIEVYERSGNRHLYLQIRQRDLDDIKVIPVPQRTSMTMAANFNN